MSRRPVMDAGPGINFLSLHKERLLFATLGPLAVPEVVYAEIRKKSRQDRRFEPAERVLDKLPERLLEVLADDFTEPLAAVVERLGGAPITQRVRSAKDLGETMVIAHAIVAAEAGAAMTVLIDDQQGRRMAVQEAQRLERLRAGGQDVGQLRLISTATVLRSAAGSEHLRNQHEMRTLYARLRNLDDGLVPIEQTDLLDPRWWR